ncbi:hypothetical protein [Paraburkholderia aromaticivorans]|uniref:hypothetical protein n=1 Tax=Paraburkholderia aromaticivorans TaxID=2026199 RepID=UPI0038BD4A15
MGIFGSKLKKPEPGYINAVVDGGETTQAARDAITDYYLTKKEDYEEASVYFDSLFNKGQPILPLFVASDNWLTLVQSILKNGRDDETTGEHVKLVNRLMDGLPKDQQNAFMVFYVELRDFTLKLIRQTYSNRNQTPPSELDGLVAYVASFNASEEKKEDIDAQIEELKRKLASTSNMPVALKKQLTELLDVLQQAKNNAKTQTTQTSKVKSAPSKDDTAQEYREFFPRFKSSYTVHDDFASSANDMMDFFRDLDAHLIECTRTQPANTLDNHYKDMVYNNLIRVHLYSALYGQPGLMETTLAFADREGMPWLKRYIALSDLKPLLAYTFDKVIAPAVSGQNAKSLIASYAENAPSWINPELSYEQLKHASDEQIRDHFMQFVRFLHLGPIQVLTQAGFFEAIIENPEQGTSGLQAYKNTWVSTNLKHAISNLGMMKDVGYVSLDEYPNQGPNIALLFMFFGYQLNQDVRRDNSGNVIGSTQRYDASDIPSFGEHATQVMASQSGSYIFEGLF